MKRVSNPAYKGKWEAKKIANPEFVDDDNLHLVKMQLEMLTKALKWVNVLKFKFVSDQGCDNHLKLIQIVSMTKLSCNRKALKCLCGMACDSGVGQLQQAVPQLCAHHCSPSRVDPYLRI